MGFLQELPSYRSVLRRRAAAGDVQERRGNLRGTAAAELRGPQPEGEERGARPLWELPVSIAEKRRIRFFTLAFLYAFKRDLLLKECSTREMKGGTEWGLLVPAGHCFEKLLSLFCQEPVAAPPAAVWLRHRAGGRLTG